MKGIRRLHFQLPTLALLAVAAGGAFPASASAAIVGVNISTVVHDANHQTVTSSPVTEAVHARVSVGGVDHSAVTGTVTATFYRGTTCTELTKVVVGQPVVLVGGVADNLLPQKLVTAGAYRYRVAYSGDATHSEGLGACTPITFTKVDPKVDARLHDESHAPTGALSAGVLVHVAVTARGDAGTPTGNVTASFYLSGDCSGGIEATATAPLSAGAVDLTGAEFTRQTAGEASYRVSYAGNGFYNAWTVCVRIKFSALVTASPGASPSPTPTIGPGPTGTPSASSPAVSPTPSVGATNAATASPGPGSTAGASPGASGSALPGASAGQSPGASPAAGASGSLPSGLSAPPSTLTPGVPGAGASGDLAGSPGSTAAGGTPTPAPAGGEGGPGVILLGLFLVGILVVAGAGFVARKRVRGIG